MINKLLKKAIVAFLHLSMVATVSWAGDLIVRPQAGVGLSNLGETVSHVGVRILSSVNDKQGYGIELSALYEKNRIWLCLGAILEQRLWNWFNMAIGTVGYFHLNSPGPQPFGLLANLGWEPAEKTSIIRPYITWRSETIFDQPILSINSISLGMTF